VHERGLEPPHLAVPEPKSPKLFWIDADCCNFEGLREAFGVRRRRLVGVPTIADASASRSGAFYSRGTKVTAIGKWTVASLSARRLSEVANGRS